MKRYTLLKTLGDGGFGSVLQCQDSETGEIVAIKKMKQKFKSFSECLELKEIKSLRKIHHENVVKLMQVFRENDFLYLVMELCGSSLLKEINQTSQPFPEPLIRDVMIQMLKGLQYVHKQGFFHRDLKPDNIMFNGDVLKIIDFGLAREIRSRPPFTHYSGTRWYRAPEVMLGHDFYNSPVDLWAAGIICAEMFILKPLFQGASETDQMYKIFACIGTPAAVGWTDGVRLAEKKGFKFANTIASGLASQIPNASPMALDFITNCLQLDPHKRLSASSALNHPFLQGERMTITQFKNTKKEVEKEVAKTDSFYQQNIVEKMKYSTTPIEDSNFYKSSDTNYNNDNQPHYQTMPFNGMQNVNDTNLLRTGSKSRLQTNVLNQIITPANTVKKIDYSQFNQPGILNDDLFDDLDNF